MTDSQLLYEVRLRTDSLVTIHQQLLIAGQTLHAMGGCLPDEVVRHLRSQAHGSKEWQLGQ